MTGKRRQKWVSGKTKRACEQAALDALQDAKSGFGGTLGKETMREFVERWLAAVEPTVRPSTFRRYRDVVRLHVLPVIGGINVAKLTPLDVQRLYADRLSAGLSVTSQEVCKSDRGR